MQRVQRLLSFIIFAASLRLRLLFSRRFYAPRAALYVLLVILCSLSPVTCPLSYAQSDTARISGQITDPSGHSVPNALVKIMNRDTGVVTQTTTNGEGMYAINGLIPGHYRMTVHKDGFREVILDSLVLNIQDVVNQNLHLDVGSVSESVTVTASQNNINTTDGTVSTVVDQSYIENMPLNGRSFQDLILLTPGVVTSSPQGSLNGSDGVGGHGEFSVNGQRTEANYYTVDGVGANTGVAQSSPSGLLSASQATRQGSLGGATAASTALGTTQALVSVDDLQEFRVQSSSYSAQYGRNPGGQFAFQTKSGTNQWHGDAYDYLRNTVFDANDWFSNFYGLPLAALRQNDFGGALGGPVRIPHVYNGKDKTFFFVNYEGLRLTQPQEPQIYYVPDNCMRGVPGACAGLIGPTGQPRQPAATALLPIVNSFPLPNPNREEMNVGDGIGVDGVGGYLAAFSNNSSIDSYSIRLDQVINDKMTIFFRYSDTSSFALSQGSQLSGNAPSAVTKLPTLTRTFTFGANNIVSSPLSNEFRLNYSSNQYTDNTFQIPVNGSVPVNLQALYGVPSSATAFESFNFNLGNEEISQQQATPTFDQDKQWNAVDTVSYSLGAHQFKFGVDYLRATPLGEVPLYEIGYALANLAEPDVEQGNVSASFSIDKNAYPLYQNFSAFAQDTWKVSSRLSLDYGLRWEVNPSVGVTQGMYPSTLVGTNTTDFAPAPPGTTLYHTTWFNFAPRLGAAYIVRDTPGWETVVRGGGGVFFDTGQQLDSAAFFGPGYQSFTQGIVGTFPEPLVIPTSTNLLIGYYPHLQLPYTLEWNVSIQQALGRSQSVTVSYVGSHASRLLQQNQFMETVPQPKVFQFIQNGLTSDYDALQLQYQRKLSHGLTVLASYGWSHCIDWGSVNIGLQYQRGNCDYDVRQNFSAAFSYNLPNVGGNGFVKAILDHWGVDDRFTARTAMPVFLTGSPTLDQQTGQQLPAAYVVVLGPNGQSLPQYIYGATCAQHFSALLASAGLPDVCPGGRAINPCAFALAGRVIQLPSGTRTFPPTPNPGCPSLASAHETAGGLAPRNTLRGFGAVQMDLAIRREFPIHERLKLQFRAEAFNVFNHTNFGAISTSGSVFGLASGTLATSLGVLSPQYQMGGPRSLQFALKLIF